MPMSSSNVAVRLLYVLLGMILLGITHDGVSEADAPYLYVLGTAQDAGFPQAGCYQSHCMRGWNDADKRIFATSLAMIDPSKRKKYLFEATPNFPEQLYMLEQQAPASDGFSLEGIFITHAHMGHYSGLMYLGREVMGSEQVPVYLMPKMAHFIRNNGPWSQLVDLNNIVLMPLADKTSIIFDSFSITPFLVPHRDEFSETVGFLIQGNNKTALFIPDINKWSRWNKDIAEEIKKVDYALIDATFYGQGELPGRDMSKIPHPLVTETMTLLTRLPKVERNKVWFIHMNHTNPLLDPSSKESQQVRSLGYHIATEGIRLDL